MSYALEDLAAGYTGLFDACQIRPEAMNQVRDIVGRITPNQSRYAALEQTTTVPWYVIALIHNLEGDLDFGTHLANGDSLRHRTVNEPAGLIADIDPPYTFEQGAIVALEHDGLNRITTWDIPTICFEFETFNGFGYRSHNINTPYLWAGSQLYTCGKYVRDGVYDPDATDDQIGSAVLLKYMITNGIVALRAINMSGVV
jgi:lysozyme family protein